MVWCCKLLPSQRKKKKLVLGNVYRYCIDQITVRHTNTILSINTYNTAFSFTMQIKMKWQQFSLIAEVRELSKISFVVGNLDNILFLFIFVIRLFQNNGLIHRMSCVWMFTEEFTCSCTKTVAFR